MEVEKVLGEQEQLEQEIVGEQLEVIEEPEKSKEVEFEQRARIQGWVPEDEFRGDKERWITAKDFVERADHMMPILKSVNAKHERKILKLEKDLKEQKELSKKMIKIHGKYSTDLHDSRISDIKARKLAAVEAGETDLYKTLEDEESKIEKPEVIAEPEEEIIPTKTKNPDVVRWEQENAHWYGEDTELTEYAEIIAEKMAKGGHSYGDDSYGFCNAVKAKVKTMFPNKFTAPGATGGSGPDEPNTRGAEAPKTKGKTWNDLPADAKAQCANNIASIPNYTKEKYIKDYFEEA